jgi:hypothetical protein
MTTFAVHAISREGNDIESRFGNRSTALLAMAKGPFVNPLQCVKYRFPHRLFGVFQHKFFVNRFAHLAVVLAWRLGIVENNLEHSVDLVSRSVTHFEQLVLFNL